LGKSTGRVRVFNVPSSEERGFSFGGGMDNGEDEEGHLGKSVPVSGKEEAGWAKTSTCGTIQSASAIKHGGKMKSG